MKPTSRVEIFTSASTGPMSGVAVINRSPDFRIEPTESLVTVKTTDRHRARQSAPAPWCFLAFSSCAARRVARVPRRDDFLADLCRPGLDESLAVGAAAKRAAPRNPSGCSVEVLDLRIISSSRILRGQLVEQRAGPFFQQLVARMSSTLLGDRSALASCRVSCRLRPFDVVARVCADLLIETIDLRLILGDPLRIEPTLQGRSYCCWSRRRRRGKTAAGRRVPPRSRSRSARRDWRSGPSTAARRRREGRIEPRQNLPLDDTFGLRLTSRLLMIDLIVSA